jgi:hypothetical protein
MIAFTPKLKAKFVPSTGEPLWAESKDKHHDFQQCDCKETRHLIFLIDGIGSVILASVSVARAVAMTEFGH